MPLGKETCVLMSDVCGGSTIQHVFSPIFSLVKRKLYVSSINQFRCDDQVFQRVPLS